MGSLFSGLIFPVATRCRPTLLWPANDRRLPNQRSLFPYFLDDVEHGLGVGGFFERRAEIGFMEELGDVGQRVEMFSGTGPGAREKA